MATSDTPGDRPVLLLLDGHSLAYRAFFALPVENFSTTTGQHTNAVYGFTSMLINVLRDEAPTHVAVAFDVSRETFRLEEYSEYKAKRAKTPDEFQGQVSLVKEVLDALHIEVFEKPGYEADDIIATLATQARDVGYDVSILTGDRDALQLVTPRSTVLYPMRGVSELARMTPDAVEERYLVPPDRYRDLAALVGETSDNLPGVPGVGPKTAAKWIGQYDGLDGIREHLGEIKGKAGQSLRDHWSDVERNYFLNALVCDLDLSKSPADLELQPWDRDAVHTIFDGLEFKVLRDRLFQTLSSDEPEVADAAELDMRVLGPDTIGAWLDDHADDVIGLHVSGHWANGTGDVSGLALATRGGVAVAVEPQEMSAADEAAVGRWLADPERATVVHDAKGPMWALQARGWTLAGLVCDTAVAAYLVRPDQRSYDLADLSLRYLHRELADDASGDQLTLDLDGDSGLQAAHDAMRRANAAVDLAAVLEDELESTDMVRLLADLELPLEQVLATIERVGIAVDVDHLESLKSEFDSRVQAAARAAGDAIAEYTDGPINLGSPKQLQVVLFEKLGMPKTKKTKTGWTTDAEALATLYEKTEHPFLQHLLEHRDQIRLRQTVEGLLKTIQDDGRIHTTFHQTIAATGRLSSTDPNLQNIPIRTEAGRRIREAFVVGEGYETLLTADYSQIEMRIMAHLSDDAGLIEAFHAGEDFHSVTAAHVFQVDAAEVGIEARSKIKAMNYGLAYGLSAYGLSQQLRIEPAEASELMDEYFKRFGGVRDYLAGVVDEARRSGYTATLLGRRRYLPDLTSDNRQRREMAERMALNAPIQGSAADIIKVAMLGVDRALTSEGLASRVLLQVHDELVLEVAPGELEVLERLVRREMGAAYELKVPLEVSVGVGGSWHEAGH